MADNRISEDTRARIAAAWPQIMEDISAGGLIRDAIARAGFTGGMLRAYRAMCPAADQEWQKAKEESADAYFDEIREMTNTAHLDAASARVNMDGLKWLAAKRNPRVYSDKSTVDLNVRTVDLTRIISDANARLEASKALGRVIEGEAVRLALTDLL